MRKYNRGRGGPVHRWVFLGIGNVQAFLIPTWWPVHIICVLICVLGLIFSKYSQSGILLWVAQRMRGKVLTFKKITGILKMSIFVENLQIQYLNFRVGNSLIRSDRSSQMSDCEWFAQIAQDKWAPVIQSLRSLMSKEQIAHSLIFLQKTRD